MELNAADFEDPFAFDAATLSKDDLHLRLYVPLFAPMTAIASEMLNILLLMSTHTQPPHLRCLSLRGWGVWTFLQATGHNPR